MNRTTIAAVTITALLVAVAPAAADRFLTGADVKNGTLTGADIRNHSIKPVDLSRTAQRHGGVRAIKATDLAPSAVKILTETDATVKAETAVEVDAGQVSTVAVLCPVDRLAVAGGGGWVRHTQIGTLGSNRPIIDDTGALRGWEVAGRTNSTEGDMLEVYAICVR